jgi:hypothetical protein
MRKDRTKRNPEISLNRVFVSALRARVCECSASLAMLFMFAQPRVCECSASLAMLFMFAHFGQMRCLFCCCFFCPAWQLTRR